MPIGEAAKGYRAQGQVAQESEALMRVAAAEQSSGRYWEAVRTLERALSGVQVEQPARFAVLGSGSRGACLKRKAI